MRQCRFAGRVPRAAAGVGPVRGKARQHQHSRPTRLGLEDRLQGFQPVCHAQHVHVQQRPKRFRCERFRVCRQPDAGRQHGQLNPQVPQHHLGQRRLNRHRIAHVRQRHQRLPAEHDHFLGHPLKPCFIASHQRHMPPLPRQRQRQRPPNPA